MDGLMGKVAERFEAKTERENMLQELFFLTGSETVVNELLAAMVQSLREAREERLNEELH